MSGSNIKLNSLGRQSGIEAFLGENRRVLLICAQIIDFEPNIHAEIGLFSGTGTPRRAHGNGHGGDVLQDGLVHQYCLVCIWDSKVFTEDDIGLVLGRSAHLADSVAGSWSDSGRGSEGWRFLFLEHQHHLGWGQTTQGRTMVEWSQLASKRTGRQSH